MKSIFTFLLLIIFWLNAVSDDSVSGKPKQKKPAKHETPVTAHTNMIRTDSVSGYSIDVNGELNSVQITTDAPAEKSLEAEAKHKRNSNSIEINGAGNSVSINQIKNGGKVNIRQNGSGNQVNILRSNHSSEK